jgi:hypothetical protein
MSSYKIGGIKIEDFVKRMLFRAWEFSDVVGMGALQDRGPNMTENHIYENVVNMSDYPYKIGRPNHINADYVFGRMMKLRFKIENDILETNNDNDYRLDYQSFYLKYPNFRSLVNAIAEEMGASVEIL